ncbi:MAG: PQQ-dependent sugar dehydrogenase [Kangiellaceae bacterium]|jgi:glucose/arabinose dehydrogenase|nr:PQQ-dependent sugar dehydrogenase [Kangiellaceae bacterium]
MSSNVDAANRAAQETLKVQREVISDAVSYPWSIAFLPDNQLLVTQKNGALKRITSNGEITVIKNVPEVYFQSQAGLFDVVVHPGYSNNNLIFLAYAIGDMSSNTLRVISAQLAGDQLTNIKVLTEVEPYKDTPVHYGGRMALLPDNTLLITTGDGFDYREKAQKLDTGLGKVLRINLDGSAPSDNPFAKLSGANNTIWTYGHRNPQGLLYDPVRKQAFLHEHGPAGGDEINLLEPGNNYGWPVITHGKDYSGARISPFEQYPDMQQPLLHWTPSIAPSGFAVYYGDKFPQMVGDFLVGALKTRELRWVKMEGNKVIGQQTLLADLDARIRDVRVSPDGYIYLVTDGEGGKVMRLSPASEDRRDN